MSRRQEGETIHAFQHRLIQERYAAADALRKGGTGADRYRRREALKRAWWTLTGHLRSQHGYRRPFLMMTREQVEQIHQDLHASELDTSQT